MIIHRAAPWLLLAIALGTLGASGPGHGVPGERADIIVASDGSGDVRTIQDALDRVPANNLKQHIILIRRGIYHEKLFIRASHIALVGEDRATTWVHFAELRRNWRASHADDWGAAVVNIADNVTDVTIANLTIRNDYGALYGDHDHQFAVRSGTGVSRIVLLDDTVAADGGDTLSLWNTADGMYYHADCAFEGWVDYVCPRGWCYITNSRFFGHSQTASIWHDGSADPDSKFVIRHSSFDGDPGFALGRNNRDGQFYVLDSQFSAAMADRPIYLPSARDSYKWGERYYYANDHRSAGDFGWFADNLQRAPGAPAADAITARWTFHGRWDPERDTPAILPFAAMPEPEHLATDVAVPNTTLRWTAGRNATSQIIRFGRVEPPPIVSRQTATTFRPGRLAAATTYFWRVDQNTPSGLIDGPVWQFTTRSR